MGVPLTMAELLVADLVVAAGLLLLDNLAERERPQRLRQDDELPGPDGHLSSARPEQRAGHAYEVSQIQIVEQAEDFLADLVSLQVDLNASAGVGQVKEGCLAVRAQGNDTPRYAPRNLRSVVVEDFEQRGGVVVYAPPRRIWIDAALLERGQLRVPRGLGIRLAHGTTAPGTPTALRRSAGGTLP